MICFIHGMVSISQSCVPLPHVLLILHLCCCYDIIYICLNVTFLMAYYKYACYASKIEWFLRLPQGPPYGESLCFTGRKGGRRIITRSYNFFHFYVRRRNLSHRSHAVDASTATIRRTYGGRTVARTFTVWSPCGRLAYALIFVIKTTAAAGTPYGDRASSPQRT